MENSGFDKAAFNSMIRAYAEAGYPFDFATVESYEEFAAAYPPTTKRELRAMSSALLAGGLLRSCYVIATSGSTEPPVIMGSRILHTTHEDSYPHHARQLLQTHVFSSGDIAANLLTPGCFGQNYEGMSRVLEAVGATILPVGRMETMGDPGTMLGVMSAFNTNTIVGSPTGIIQLARLAEEHDVVLPIRKIVFMGEAFHEGKRPYLQRVWPGCRIYSVYGASELGFVGVNTPEMAAREHIVLSRWFFLEVAADGELLVTDLKTPMLPILRYRIGDRARLVQREDGPRLVLDGRCDGKFSLGGVRVDVGQIREVLRGLDCETEDMQITLSTDTRGRDVVRVATGIATLEGSRRLESAIARIPALGAAVSRGVSVIEVTGDPERYCNARGKTPVLRDLREEGAGLAPATEDVGP